MGLHEAAVRQGTQIYCGRARARDGDLGQVRFGRAWPERPYVLSLPQSRTELLLEERLAALAPAALHRGWEVTALRTHHGGVEVTAREDGASVPGMRIRASVVVGADGARSRVRELLAIGTTGTEHPDTYLMGDLADPADGSGNTASAREAFIHLEPDGVVESFPLPDGRRRWVVHTGVNPPAHPAPEPAPETLTELVRSRTRIRLDPGSTTMLSAFTVRRRSAWPLLRGRAVLLGDAAHEISPIGGQGITLGLLDALDVAPLLKRSVTRRRRGPLRADPPGGVRRGECGVALSLPACSRMRTRLQAVRCLRRCRGCGSGPCASPCPPRCATYWAGCTRWAGRVPRQQVEARARERRARGLRAGYTMAADFGHEKESGRSETP
ncbi:NAD(P)/FAD-dependent oxidoreductase [Brachybacterium sp. Z12]|uniref:FAD-dependent oxidoreductase n=1 Tax=Brachybacterium sp. Z12 TaxID=2759167 RepID=UPI00223BF5A8|nr:NAD(P)/FAD-dependent oxidoreductase [Brachybacterium sp. Z12]